MLIYSCKKNCSETNDNKFKGKIKTLTEYSTDSTNVLYRYYYYYDSSTGDLTSVDIGAKLSGTYLYTGRYVIEKKTNDSLIIYANAIGRKFLIETNGKQLIRIKEIDTVTGIYYYASYINLIDGKVDYAEDTGYNNFVSKNIKYSDFIYNGSNCISFVTNWTENITGNYIQKYTKDSFVYSNVLYSTNFPFQYEYSGSSIINFLLTFLCVDGYYLIKPSDFLIKKKYTYFDYNFTTSYEYNYTNQKITRVKINSSVVETEFKDLTYY